MTACYVLSLFVGKDMGGGDPKKYINKTNQTRNDVRRWVLGVSCSFGNGWTKKWIVSCRYVLFCRRLVRMGGKVIETKPK